MKTLNLIHLTTGVGREIFRPFIGRFAVLILISSTLQLSLMLPMAIFAEINTKISNTTIAQHESIEAVLKHIGGITGAIFITIFLYLAGKMYSHLRIRSPLAGAVRKIAFEKLCGMSLGQAVNQNTGLSTGRIEKGIASMNHLIKQFIDSVTGLCCRFCVSLAMIAFVLDWQLALVVLVTLVGYFKLGAMINHRTQPDLAAYNKLDDEIKKVYKEKIGNLRFILISNQAKKEVSEFERDYAKYLKLGESIWSRFLIETSLFQDLLCALGFVAALTLSVAKVYNGELGVVEWVTGVGIIINAFVGLSSIGLFQRSLAENWPQVAALIGHLETPPAISFPKNPIKFRPEEFKGRIEFQDVHYIYKGDKNDVALRGVSFVVPECTSCALFGENGAGKSTVLHLLARGDDPDQGRILLDGHDLRDVDVGHLRSTIMAYVEQSGSLPSNKSIEDIIRYGMNGHADYVTEADLDRVAKISGLDRFYERFGSERLRMRIGENGGVKLSGGMRQSTLLAYALIKNPRLLMLDEATNALDWKSEEIIHAAIIEAVRGRTCIISAHRPVTAATVNQVIVLENGKVRMSGKHNDMLSDSWYYSFMYAQTKQMTNSVF